MEIFKFVFSPVGDNNYVLVNESGDCAIIDCSCYENEESEELASFFSSKKLTPVLYVNTHCHFDHTFGNEFLLKKYGLKSRSSALEEMNRKNSVMHASLFGLTVKEPPEPGYFISDNDILKFGSTEFKALLIPGHTSGSLVYYFEKEGCLFTGDVLFAGSVGRSDLDGGDHVTLINGIRNRLFVLPLSTKVYPGHGRETTIGNEIETNPFFVK
jgi:hydroxyacylglutathione hydrolase